MLAAYEMFNLAVLIGVQEFLLLTCLMTKYLLDMCDLCVSTGDASGGLQRVHHDRFHSRPRLHDEA
eukprot:387722-Pleurochrysis_carterae.AAC.3